MRRVVVGRSRSVSGNHKVGTWARKLTSALSATLDKKEEDCCVFVFELLLSRSAALLSIRRLEREERR